ncbi:helix-turn-helix domain-containing protein [Rhodobacter sp. TJ_12]|uniref:helix-turn-helix domain-containing protein n=1 Tax=Rhodobacter sp. TJ_12 TaxID=2029399 RepID=UPI001CBF7817|nr:helix-turn-helix domain-containing protein [Rhodobacter sp. TJ_12]
MAGTRHPVTGVELNDMPIVRKGTVTDDERQTAALLLAEGMPRWLVAAKLGRHPLAFNATGRKPAQSMTPAPTGRSMSLAAAHADDRQSAFDDLFDAPEEQETDHAHG